MFVRVREGTQLRPVDTASSAYYSVIVLFTLRTDHHLTRGHKHFTPVYSNQHKRTKLKESFRVWLFHRWSSGTSPVFQQQVHDVHTHNSRVLAIFSKGLADNFYSAVGSHKAKNISHTCATSTVAECAGNRAQLSSLSGGVNPRR